MWEHGLDVSKPDILGQVLRSNGKFDGEEVERVLEAGKSAEIKEELNANTKEALERGAFGCPWFWVENGKGVEEPFFGSDRYVQFSSSSSCSCSRRQGKIGREW